jgi:hypothetical protein
MTGLNERLPLVGFITYKDTKKRKKKEWKVAFLRFATFEGYSDLEKAG